MQQEMTMQPSDFNFPEYAALCAAIESGATEYGHGYFATNKTSTAYGRYQLINAVFIDFLGKVDHSPLSQEVAFYRLTIRNIRALINRGIPVTYMTVYTLHNLGTNGGVEKIRGGLEDSYFSGIAEKLNAARKAIGE